MLAAITINGVLRGKGYHCEVQRKDDTFVKNEENDGDRKKICNLEKYVKILQKWIKLFIRVVYILLCH